MTMYKLHDYTLFYTSPVFSPLKIKTNLPLSLPKYNPTVVNVTWSFLVLKKKKSGSSTLPETYFRTSTVVYHTNFFTYYLISFLIPSISS